MESFSRGESFARTSKGTPSFRRCLTCLGFASSCPQEKAGCGGGCEPKREAGEGMKCFDLPHSSSSLLASPRPRRARSWASQHAPRRAHTHAVSSPGVPGLFHSSVRQCETENATCRLCFSARTFQKCFNFGILYLICKKCLKQIPDFVEHSPLLSCSPKVS